ncbi:MAG: 50S ribosomal protein L23 [Microscillaceae bacterium]|nr:50S ribosomal protein L23 [Microscillaceae bacterium]
MDRTDIILRPLLTEKISTLDDKLKGGKERYAFVVNAKANKLQIAQAIEELYNIPVESVNTMNYKGKPKTRYTKTKVVSGRTSAYKKAIVTVAEGEFIDFYNNV